MIFVLFFRQCKLLKTNNHSSLMAYSGNSYKGVDEFIKKYLSFERKISKFGGSFRQNHHVGLYKKYFDTTYYFN